MSNINETALITILEPPSDVDELDVPNVTSVPSALPASVYTPQEQVPFAEASKASNAFLEPSVTDSKGDVDLSDWLMDQKQLSLEETKEHRKEKMSEKGQEQMQDTVGCDFPPQTVAVLAIICDHFQKLSLLLSLDISWPRTDLWPGVDWRSLTSYVSSVFGLDLASFISAPLVTEEFALAVALLLPALLTGALASVQYVHGNDEGHVLFNRFALQDSEYTDTNDDNQTSRWRWNHVRLLWLLLFASVSAPLCVFALWSWALAWLALHTTLAAVLWWARSLALAFLHMAPQLHSPPATMLHSFHRMWAERISTIIGFLLIQVYITPLRQCLVYASSSDPDIPNNDSDRNFWVGAGAAGLLLVGCMTVLKAQLSTVVRMCVVCASMTLCVLVAALASTPQNSGSRGGTVFAGLCFLLYLVLPQCLVFWCTKRLLAGEYDAEQLPPLRALAGVWPTRSTWRCCGHLQPFYRLYTLSQRALFVVVAVLGSDNSVGSSASPPLLALFAIVVAVTQPYAQVAQTVLESGHLLVLGLISLLPQVVNDNAGQACTLLTCTVGFLCAVSWRLEPARQIQALLFMRTRALLQAQALMQTKDWVKLQKPENWLAFDFRTVQFWAEKSTGTMLGLFPDVVRSHPNQFQPVFRVLSSLNVYGWKRKLTAAQWHFIGVALRCMPNLQRISGENATAIGELGGVTIASAITAGAVGYEEDDIPLPVRDVRLRNCGLGVNCAKAWATALVHRTPIQTLDLGDNPEIGSEGVAAIVRALSSQATAPLVLKKLIVQGCGSPDGRMDAFTTVPSSIQVVSDVQS